MHTKSLPLFFTRKKLLLDGFIRHLKSQKIDSIPLLINDISDLAGHRSNFEACDMVLFDINEDPLFLDLVSHLLDEIPSFVPLIALKSTDEVPQDLRQQPGFLRLAGVTALKKGWGTAWEKAAEMQRAWKSPYMHSRIEDVSPSDVLQMIGISQWTSSVRLEGRRSIPVPTNDQGVQVTRGCISFVKGIPECAWSTNHTGNAAVLELLSLSHGTLEVTHQVWSCGIRNVNGSIDELLFAFALRMDESHTRRQESSEPTAPLPDPPANAHWTENRQRHFLDRWWSRNSQAIADTFRNSNSGKYPLRWMKWRELERLAASKIQTRFLIVLGDEHFILDHLKPYAKQITEDKLTEEDLPVVRLEKFENDTLYLIGIRKPADALHVLNQYPFVISCSSVSGEYLSAVIKSRAWAAVVISDNAETALKMVSEAGKNHLVNFCCLQVARNAESYSATLTFKHVAESLAKMTEEPRV